MKKKVLLRVLLAGMTLAVLAAVMTFTAFAEEQTATNTEPQNGFVTVDDVLYYYENGERVTGWFEADGIQYYASKVNFAVINYDKTIGGKLYLWNDATGLALANGFVETEGGTVCYKDGYQVIGWRHADGTGPVIGEDGISEQYSTSPNNLYYFLSTTGYMVTDSTYKLCGFIHEFNDDHTVKPLNGFQLRYGVLYAYENGMPITGWQTDEATGNTYYFQQNDTGVIRAVSKWMYIGDNLYYFYASNSTPAYSLKTDGKIGGNTYTFGENGQILYTGFINTDYANQHSNNTSKFIFKMNGTTRFLVNGEMQYGWHYIDGTWYYFFPKGSEYGAGYMCTENCTIDGVEYEFSQTGACTSRTDVPEDPSCKHANTEVKDALGATCTTDGYTGDTYCTDCGEKIATGTTIPATGHMTEIRDAIPADCTTIGYTGDTYCTVCGEMTESGKFVPKTEHDFTDGVCAKCGEKQSDKFYLFTGEGEDPLNGASYVHDNRYTNTTAYWVTNGQIIIPGEGYAFEARALRGNVALYFANDFDAWDGLQWTSGLQLPGKTNHFSFDAYAPNGYEVPQYDGWEVRDATTGNRVWALTNAIAVPAGSNIVHIDLYLTDYSGNALYTDMIYIAGFKFIANYGYPVFIDNLCAEDMEISAPCTHENVQAVGKVDATCHSTGMTGVVTCLDCGTKISDDVYVPMTEHNYVDGVCTECGENQNDTFVMFDGEGDDPLNGATYVHTTRGTGTIAHLATNGTYVSDVGIDYLAKAARGEGTLYLSNNVSSWDGLEWVDGLALPFMTNHFSFDVYAPNGYSTPQYDGWYVRDANGNKTWVKTSAISVPAGEGIVHVDIYLTDYSGNDVYTDMVYIAAFQFIGNYGNPVFMDNICAIRPDAE